MDKSRVVVDSNVILDIITGDPRWSLWSLNMLIKHSDSHKLIINQIIYSEVSTRFADSAELDVILAQAKLFYESLPLEAAFLAGKCFLQYRKRAGKDKKTAILPDFYIGAHAVVTNSILLTRDTRYSSYFHGLEIVCPERELCMMQ